MAVIKIRSYRPPTHRRPVRRNAVADKNESCRTRLGGLSPGPPAAAAPRSNVQCARYRLARGPVQSRTVVVGTDAVAPFVCVSTNAPDENTDVGGGPIRLARSSRGVLSPLCLFRGFRHVTGAHTHTRRTTLVVSA